MACAIDFETYYDRTVSITRMGNDSYVAHPEADAYLVTFVDDDLEYCGSVEDAPWDEISGRDFVSHNARFDEAVFHECKRRRQIPANIRFNDWFCTADMSVYLDGPRSLKDAGSVFLGAEVSKEYRAVAKGKRRRDFTAEEWEIVVKAGLDDARTCHRLWKRLSPLWPEHERAVSRLNREATKRGCMVDTDLLDRSIGHISTRLWELNKTIPWDWEGNKTPLGITKIRAECRRSQIPCPASLAQDSEDCLEWEAEYADRFPWVAAIRDWRKTNTLLGKLETVRGRLRNDPVTGEFGNFPFTLKYFGAHTGRFSGDGGFNMQNIYAREFEGVDVRSLFIPRPGKKMLVVDYCQIEPRILMWLCNDLAGLDKVRGGMSVYEVHARETMGYALEKALKEHDPKTYKLAKARVLGLGYGCGAAKFRNVALNMAGLVLEPEECAEIVSAYRATNPKVTGYWRRLDGLLRNAVHRGDKKLSLRLPSGRCMNYYDVAAVDRKVTVRPGLSAHRVTTWGGKLCFGAETLVLTSRGAIPICSVTSRDRVWDGTNWVSTSGPVRKGIQEVGRWLTIPVTADHRITDGSSWKKAMDVDVGFSLAALRWARDSISLPLFRKGLATAAGMDLETLGPVPGGKAVEIEGTHATWTPTRESMPVFDLLNCGPNHRYAIATPFGPVVVHNCENVVQAVARDVFVDGWLKAAAAFPDPGELRLLFTVHDEFVFEADPGFDVSRLEAVLRQPPDWGKTLPLDVESMMVDHYFK